jgi:hypothetical protein
MSNLQNMIANNYAFPSAGNGRGMTFREYLVGQAIAGLCAGETVITDRIAKNALKIADDAIRALAHEEATE